MHLTQKAERHRFLVHVHNAVDFFSQQPAFFAFMYLSNTGVDVLNVMRYLCNPL